MSGTAMTGRTARTECGIAKALHVSLTAAAVFALTATEVGAQAPVDTAGLGAGPWATASMLYERTFLNVDVLRITVRFGVETAERLQAADEAGRDSLAHIAIDSRNALIRSVFLRDVGLGQFLEGLRENLAHVQERGFITEAEHQRILADVESQYRPLAERGIRDGDVMWYRVRGDTLEVVVEAVEGGTPVVQRAVGAERRRATLGGYFVRGSDFRDKLIDSLGRE